MQLLKAFSHELTTTKQAARMQRAKPYHVKVLERVDLITLVITSNRRGAMGKYYNAIAWLFTVDHKLLELEPHTDNTIDKPQMVATTMLEEILFIVYQSAAHKCMRQQNERRPAILVHFCISTIPRAQKNWVKRSGSC